MGKPVTLLERISGHVLSFDSRFLTVENKDGREWVFADIGGSMVRIADFGSRSVQARDLRADLKAAAKKPVRTVIHGQVSILKVRVFEGFGEDVFEVTIDAAPKRDPSIAPQFTAKQGQYLAFIDNYTRIHRQAPAETDLERHFRVSAPSAHNMIKTLERNGLIERTPGKARSIRLLVKPEFLPRLA